VKVADFKHRPDIGAQADRREIAQGPAGLTATSAAGPSLLEPWHALAKAQGAEEDFRLGEVISHISASSARLANDCPRAWAQRYLHGRKEAPGQKMVLGQLFHGGTEFGLDLKMITSEAPPLDLMVEYYHDSVWPQTLDRYGGEGEIVWDDKPESVRHKGVELVTVYQPRIQIVEPEAIEHEFLIDVGIQLPVKGVIDVVQANQRPLIDFKTSGRKESEMKSEWRFQGNVYQLYAPRTFDIHQVTTTKSPEVVTGLENDAMVEYYSERIAVLTVRRLQETLSDLNQLYLRHGPDEEWPMRGIHHPWRCSPRWCAYRSDCPAWLP